MTEKLKGWTKEQIAEMELASKLGDMNFEWETPQTRADKRQLEAIDKVIERKEEEKGVNKE